MTRARLYVMHTLIRTALEQVDKQYNAFVTTLPGLYYIDGDLVNNCERL